ncbi:acetate and sugar kinases/Hsc70/actin family protein [Alterinioella nitratireducens]|uniref:hypothetical protein n=1 Tax=Alterinioella nitratireducens TaxID=2735915 RepID=UPI0015569C9A|nr:hypothetical protein [Alterinioella nitratireducens]NPD21405.1 hypothetical protein [Alterinioella nitratireducens]
MDKETAVTVLKSLLERFDKSSDVFLTSIEAKSLRVVLDLDSEGVVDAPVTPSGDLSLKTPPITCPTPDDIDGDHLMCLDFGTSFSKAFASSVDDTEGVPELFPLAFGTNALGDPELLLPSELFIDNGELYLGAAARAHFDATEAVQDRLIDSPKQFITLTKDVTDLHRRKLGNQQDPSGTLTQRDALVLYLAHLNLRAEQALHEHGLSPDLKRRYAHPAWTPEHFQVNSDAMRRIIAEAIALSRCFGEDLASILPLERACEINEMARMAKDIELPFGLIDDPVLEATAAGAGALLGTPTTRRVPYVILDIGAGTTDVAGCICVNNPSRERITVAEVTPAARAINQAGNIIDNALLKMIMEKSGLADGTAEFRQVHAALKRTIRGDKEVLFTDEALSVGLVTGDVVEIELDEFVDSSIVKALFKKITDLAVDAAFCVVGDESVVYVTATGGGAGLPVVKMLDKRQIKRDGKNIQLSLVAPMPNELGETYPQLVNSYPQVAVAVGGALSNLPAQVKSIQEGISDPGRKYLAPMYKS